MTYNLIFSSIKKSLLCFEASVAAVFAEGQWDTG